jgi:hypothetical protein
MQDEIINKYRGKQMWQDFLAWFNAGLGPWAIERNTLYVWRKGGRCDKRILQHAMDVYPPDDPRHQMARELFDITPDRARKQKEAV